MIYRYLIKRIVYGKRSKYADAFLNEAHTNF